jgi:hypothetical protein
VSCRVLFVGTGLWLKCFSYFHGISDFEVGDFRTSDSLRLELCEASVHTNAKYFIEFTDLLTTRG